MELKLSTRASLVPRLFLNSPKRALLAPILRLVAPLVLALLVGCGSDASDGEKYAKPTVNAGSDQAHTLPIDNLTLSGSAKTYPAYLYSIRDTRWRQVSGPQQLALLNEDELTATALNPTAAGTYEFELYAKDSLGRTNTDLVTIVLHEAVAQSKAANTRGYADDFDVMWTSVTDHYAQYEAIQDQWQQLYQPYLLRASTIESQAQWDQLLMDLRAQVQGDQTILPNTDQGAWVESHSANGIVTLRILGIPSGQPHQLEQAILNELHLYSNAQEWVLTGLTAYATDLQTWLTLFKLFAYQDTSVCLWRRSAEPECYTLPANALLAGKPVRTDSQESSMLTQFLAAQEAGAPSVLLYPDWALGQGSGRLETTLWGVMSPYVDSVVAF
ncbi:PKD domain-containing protein [Vibrio neptunius]|uniref:PKD domain-containing protein n=1 Tax=Vibrio neptunius TaxID=170651 RepID=UPI001F08DC31|nr:hypothetical protein [Vibrio neptunius]